MNDQKLDLILAELKEIRSVQNDHGKQLKSHSEQFKSIDKQLKSHSEQFKSIDKQFNSIDKQLKSHSEQLKSQGEHLLQLIQFVGVTNTKVEELKEDVHVLKDDVNILKENQQAILEIQQEQQKILERLSVRSISHEADIAELRRIRKT